MTRPRTEPPPLGFFLSGVAGLAVLFGVTLAMEPSASVNALRGLIAFGMVVVVTKIWLRRSGVEWPRRRR